MRGKGVVLGLLVLFILCQFPMQVEAGRSERTLSWECGVKVHILVENNDFWTTDSVSELFFVLRLLEVGSVADFQELAFQATVMTKTNYTGEMIINNPWTTVGDEARVVARFVIDKEDVNSAGWDVYVAAFFFSFSILVRLAGGDELRLVTYVYEGTPLSISTFSFIVLWPFPPILLMAAVYWLLYIGLRRFNRRYEGLDTPVPGETSKEEST